MCPLAIPSGTVGGVMFLPGDDPFIPNATGERLHSRCSIIGVEVGPASHLGKCEGSEQCPILVINEGLQSQSTAQQRSGDIDIHACQFLGGNGKIHKSEAEASIGRGNEGLREPGLRHLPESCSRGIKRLGWIRNRIELRCNGSQYSLGKGASIGLELELFWAECEVNSHGWFPFSK